MDEMDRVNALKTEYQTKGFRSWVDDFGARGVFKWATAVGKTHLATHHAIPRMNIVAPMKTTRVVVPYEHLKEDWDGNKTNKGFIRENNLKNTEVFVINTFVTMRHHCDLLIIDEVHRAANEDTEYFSKVLDRCDAKYVMCLTASLTYGQEKFLHSKGIKIVSTITTREAEAQGLISPYRVYNLGIDLTPVDREYEKIVDENFTKYSGKFDGNLQLAIACCGSTNPRWNPEGGEDGRGDWYEPSNVEYAREMGWKGIDLKEAIENYKRKKKAAHGSKGEIIVWQDEPSDFEFTPTKVQIYGRQFIRFMNKRKDHLHNATAKLEATKKIFEKFNVPTLIFSQRTGFADKITKLLGDTVCASYHSKLESQPLADPLTGELIRYGKKAAKAGQVKMFGKKVIGRAILDAFKTHVLKALSTANALDEGANFPAVALAIITGGTSTERQNTQRIGRAVRAMKGKFAVIVNLFVKDSQDEHWLRRRQVADKPAIWIESIDEISFEYSNEEELFTTEDQDYSVDDDGEDIADIDFGDN